MPQTILPSSKTSAKSPNQLAQIIAAKIADSGILGFDEFMQLALYHPQFGYYRSSKPKFGRDGDFITAPETSDLFGFCLARQCVQVFAEDNSKNHNILEFGAGSGVLAAQILFEMGRLGKLPEHYFILELSARLKKIQQQTIKKVLPELIDRIIWLDKMPENFSGVVIANEVLDAMPAKRVIFKNGKFVELGVGLKNHKFIWQPFDTAYKNPKTPLPKIAPENYTSEVNLQNLAWVDSLFSVLQKGVVLIIDYGMTASEYFHPERNTGTLRCYHRHKATDQPFLHIGEQDISVSVNFSQVANQALKSGFEVGGFATQALFLTALKIADYLKSETNKNRQYALTQQLKQLILPSAMGESFKVLALQKQSQVKLDGFKDQDLRHRL